MKDGRGGDLGNEEADDDPASKVPRVTLAFWVVKILATTLGETGGDAVSMTLNLGYAIGTLIVLVALALDVWMR